MRDFWGLPGPASFVRQICKSLANGRNVALRIPASSPENLKNSLQLATQDQWGWRDVHVVPTSTAPVLAVALQLIGAPPPVGVSPYAFLANRIDLHGCILWIDGIDASSAKDWRDFLLEYEHACRDLPEANRGLCIAVFEGDVAIDAPSEEIALCSLAWDGWVSDLDMLLYSSRLVIAEHGDAPQVPLISACIARLANADPIVASVLASEAPEVVFSPLPVLRELGASRGWNETTVVRWENGTQNTVSGRARIHSAFLAVLGTASEIDRRIWCAQASVILPLLEERRVALIQKHRRFIRLPIMTNFGPIESLEDVELGPLSWQLHTNGADHNAQRLARKLKDVRNRLSHLQPLPSDLALDSDLFDI